MNITKNIQVTFSVFAFAFVSTFSMATCHTAYAQTTIEAHSSNSGLKATEQFQVGSMYVEKYANPNAKGAPVILIPGLSSGAYVWDETVKRLHNEHELYVITLAGFNGKPALVGPKFAKAKDSLLELIQTRKIHQPVLVGHSLGSALSIWFAQSHSPLIRGVFGVDGLPVFPGTQNMSVAERSSMAEASRTQMGNVDQKTFAAQQAQYMRFMGVIDEKLADQLGARSATSDPAATAEYMADLLKMDMRKDLPAITVPVALVSPYYAPDFARANMSEEAKNAFYLSLMAGTPKLSLVAINGARHFVMYDQPKIFNDKLVEFLNTL